MLIAVFADNLLLYFEAINLLIETLESFDFECFVFDMEMRFVVVDGNAFNLVQVNRNRRKDANYSVDAAGCSVYADRQQETVKQ